MELKYEVSKSKNTYKYDLSSLKIRHPEELSPTIVQDREKRKLTLSNV